MANTFSLILVLATLGTGLLWLLDRCWLTRLRAARVLRAQQAAGAALDAESIAKLVREPLVIEQAKSFFPVLAVVLVLRSFLFEPFQIPSGSMMPTLLVGDFILVQKFAYGIKEPITNRTLIETGHPKRGDVAVFKYPEAPTVDYIKRVVGLPGDRILYRNKQLYLQPACDGGDACPPLQALATDFIERGSFTQGFTGLVRLQEQVGGHVHQILINPDMPDRVPLYYRQPGHYPDEWVVPAGHYFAMGDNRDNSQDSRFWGFVPERNLVGKAVSIWISFEFEQAADSWLPAWVPSGVRFNRIGSIQ